MFKPPASMKEARAKMSSSALEPGLRIAKEQQGGTTSSTALEGGGSVCAGSRPSIGQPPPPPPPPPPPSREAARRVVKNPYAGLARSNKIAAVAGASRYAGGRGGGSLGTGGVGATAAAASSKVRAASREGAHAEYRQVALLLLVNFANTRRTVKKIK